MKMCLLLLLMFLSSCSSNVDNLNKYKLLGYANQKEKDFSQEFIYRNCGADLNIVPRWKSYDIEQNKFFLEAKLNPGNYIAHIELDGKFEEGKKYIVNRDRNKLELTVWVYDAETGEVVTDRVTTKYSKSLALQKQKSKNICRL